MSMVAVTRIPLLTVLVLPSGATEKPESACHVAAVAVPHVKVHQVHKGQTLEVAGLQGLGEGNRNCEFI